MTSKLKAKLYLWCMKGIFLFSETRSESDTMADTFSRQRSLRGAVSGSETKVWVIWPQQQIRRSALGRERYNAGLARIKDNSVFRRHFHNRFLYYMICGDENLYHMVIYHMLFRKRSVSRHCSFRGARQCQSC